jgi:hypothetical protein
MKICFALFVSAFAKPIYKYLTYLFAKTYSCTTVHDLHMVYLFKLHGQFYNWLIKRRTAANIKLAMLF